MCCRSLPQSSFSHTPSCTARPLITQQVNRFYSFQNDTHLCVAAGQLDLSKCPRVQGNFYNFYLKNTKLLHHHFVMYKMAQQTKIS